LVLLTWFLSQPRNGWSQQAFSLNHREDLFTYSFKQ